MKRKSYFVTFVANRPDGAPAFGSTFVRPVPGGPHDPMRRASDIIAVQEQIQRAFGGDGSVVVLINWTEVIDDVAATAPVPSPEPRPTKPFWDVYNGNVVIPEENPLSVH